MFVGKAGAYPRVEHLKGTSHWTLDKKVHRTEPSNSVKVPLKNTLACRSADDKEKSFVTLISGVGISRQCHRLRQGSRPCQAIPGFQVSIPFTTPGPLL
jgi:hypothetical protein